MGWLYGSEWSTKAAMVKHLVDQYRESGYTVLESASTKSGLWVVAQSQDGTPWIGLCLIERHDGQYGYKDMDESSYPYYFDCPERFLDLAPATSLPWRSGVRAFHQAKRDAKSTFKSLKVGDVVHLKGKDIPFVTITSIQGKQVGGKYDGVQYRLTPRALRGAVINPIVKEVGVQS